MARTCGHDPRRATARQPDSPASMHDRIETTLKKMRCSGKADGPRTDDGHRQIRYRHTRKACQLSGNRPARTERYSSFRTPSGRSWAPFMVGAAGESARRTRVPGDRNQPLGVDQTRW